MALLMTGRRWRRRVAAGAERLPLPPSKPFQCKGVGGPFSRPIPAWSAQILGATVENVQLILKKLHDTEPEMFGQTQMEPAFPILAKVERTDVRGLADMLNCESETAANCAESLGAAGRVDFERQFGEIAVNRQGKSIAESLERPIAG